MTSESLKRILPKKLSWPTEFRDFFCTPHGFCHQPLILTEKDVDNWANISVLENKPRAGEMA